MRLVCYGSKTDSLFKNVERGAFQIAPLARMVILKSVNGYLQLANVYYETIK